VKREGVKMSEICICGTVFSPDSYNTKFDMYTDMVRHEFGQRPRGGWIPFNRLSKTRKQSRRKIFRKIADTPEGADWLKEQGCQF